MPWDENYRMLELGEVIRAGDEVSLGDVWRDNPEWEPALCIGEKAPCPQCPAHRIYRRLKTKDK